MENAVPGLDAFCDIWPERQIGLLWITGAWWGTHTPITEIRPDPPRKKVSQKRNCGDRRSRIFLDTQCSFLSCKVTLVIVGHINCFFLLTYLFLLHCQSTISKAHHSIHTLEITKKWTAIQTDENTNKAIFPALNKKLRLLKLRK